MHQWNGYTGREDRGMVWGIGILAVLVSHVHSAITITPALASLDPSAIMPKAHFMVSTTSPRLRVGSNPYLSATSSWGLASPSSPSTDYVVKLFDINGKWKYQDVPPFGNIYLLFLKDPLKLFAGQTSSTTNYYLYTLQESSTGVISGTRGRGTQPDSIQRVGDLPESTYLIIGGNLNTWRFDVMLNIPILPLYKYRTCPNPYSPNH